MIDELQLDGRAASQVDLRTLGPHHHAVFGRRPAGEGLASAVDVDEAQAAHAGRLQVGVMAQVRDIDIVGQRRFEQRRALIGGNALSVYLEGDFLHGSDSFAFRRARARAPGPTV